MNSKGMKKTEIGLIPEDWEVKSIAELTTKILGGGTPSRLEKNYWNGTIPWATVKDLTSFDKIGTQEYISNLGLANSATRIVPKGELIIATRIGLGEIVMYDVDVCINQDLKCIYLNPTIDKQFFYYSYKNIGSKIIDKGSGSTVLGISLPDLKSFILPIPPLFEQQAIAKALSNADSWIESLEKLIAKKQLIKQGAMQRLLTPKEGWETHALSQISKVTRGASPRPIENPIWFDNASPIGWVRISDVTKSTKYLYETTQKLSRLGVENSRFVKSGSLIMSICATVGKPIITTIDVCIHDGFVMFSDLKIDQGFLYNYLKYIEPSWTKNGQTGSQMNLNTNLISLSEVSFPKSKEEQAQIASLLSAMDSEIEVLESKLEKSRQIKQGMMQQLLTGKIRLQAESVSL